MRTSRYFVNLFLICSLSLSAQEDTIFAFIEKAQDLKEQENRIIDHGGRLLYNDPARIPQLATMADRLAKKSGSQHLKASVFNLKGLYARHAGKLDSSIFYHQKALRILRQLPRDIQLSREYNHLSITWHDKGKYDRYLAYNDSALAVAKAADAQDYQQVLLNNRAYILLQLGDTAATKRLLMEILPEMDATPGSKAATYENLSKIYVWQKKPDSALHCLQAALKLSDIAGEKRLQAELLQQLGVLYFQQNYAAAAKEYWGKAFRLFDELDDVQGELQARAQKAYILSEKGKTSEAISLLDSVLADNRLREYSRMKYQLLRQKSELYEKLGEFSAALHSFREMVALRDSTHNAEAKRQIVELETKYQTREKEQELATLKKDRALKAAKAQQLYIIFTTSLLFLLLLLAYLRFYYRSKQKIAENDRARLHAEVGKRQLEEQKLWEEIELKNKQLTTKALSLSERNELLMHLQNKLRKAKEGSENQRMEALKTAEREIAMNLNNQAEWAEFNTYFEEINSGFTQRLCQQYPNLSQKELRLLSLSKLGLTTKEIANLLHVAPDSVKMARYRLKKKLNLPEKQGIEEFIASVNGSTTPLENSTNKSS